MRKHSYQGQGFVEYILLIILILLVILGALDVSGVSLKTLYCKVINSLGAKPALCNTSLFQDDFNNLDQWTIVSGTWSIQSGKLCGGPGEGKIFVNIDGASDYAINLNGAQLSAGNGYGLYFRATNFQAVNGYNFQYDPGYPGFLFREWYKSNEYAPAARVVPNNFNYYSQPHNIQVVVEGDTYTSYLDGTKLYTVNDSTYTSGGIGLRTWDSTTVCFDSIQVDPLP